MLIESGEVRKNILELTNGCTDYELINKLLKKYRRPSYTRAGLLILLWWKGSIWDCEYCTFPSPQFFHDHWKKACKRAGLRESKDDVMIKELAFWYGDTGIAEEAWKISKNMTAQELIESTGANIKILGKMPKDTDKVYQWYCSNIDCIFISSSYNKIKEEMEYCQCWNPIAGYSIFKPSLVYDCLTWRDAE